MTPDEMVAANPKTIKEVDECLGGADSYFLVHCGGRRLGLQLEGKEEQIYLEDAGYWYATELVLVDGQPLAYLCDGDGNGWYVTMDNTMNLSVVTTAF